MGRVDINESRINIKTKKNQHHKNIIWMFDYFVLIFVWPFDDDDDDVDMKNCLYITGIEPV